MKAKEQIEKLYHREVKARRMEPKQEELDAWGRAFKHCDPRDIDEALNAWNVDTRDDGNGPRGRWLPKPSELKPLVEAAQRKREAVAREPKDFVAWECQRPEGCGYRCTGWVSPTDQRGRQCVRCKRPLDEVLRERASMNTHRLHVA